MARPYMLDAVALHGVPIVAGSHNFSNQQGSTGMGSKQAFTHLFHQMVNLVGVFTSKQSCIVVPLIQDFPLKKNWHAMRLMNFHSLSVALDGYLPSLI